MFLAAPGEKECDHLLPHTRRGGTEAHEDLGGDALTLADESDEYVLAADVVVAELQWPWK